YVAWSLLDSGLRVPQLEKAIAYVREHLKDAAGNAYVLALAANALAAWDPKDDSTLAAVQQLEKLKEEKGEWKACCFRTGGQSLCYARGDCAPTETAALAVLAFLQTGQFVNTVNQALTYLGQTRAGNSTWGSTQATILSLKALTAGAEGTRQQGKATVTIRTRGKPDTKAEITEENADVMQVFDLSAQAQVGVNEVEVEVAGDTNLMYQFVGRYFEPYPEKPVVEKPVLAVNVEYDRTQLSTADLLRAKATLKYQGDSPTYMVIV